MTRLNIFLLALGVVLALTASGGETLFRLGLLSVSRHGAVMGALIIVRANAIVLGFLALTASMAPEDFARALAGLGAPPKLTLILYMKIRAVAEWRELARRRRDAMKARGFRPSASRRALGALAALTATLLIRAHERSERAFEAMKARGFQGRFIAMKPGALKRRDRLFLALSALCLAALIGLEGLL